MASSSPLQGSELIDCARANSKQGVVIAAENCGYRDDLAQFEKELQNAGKMIGVDIQSFDDLIDLNQKAEEPEIEIAPETPTQF